MAELIIRGSAGQVERDSVTESMGDCCFRAAERSGSVHRIGLSIVAHQPPFPLYRNTLQLLIILKN